MAQPFDHAFAFVEHVERDGRGVHGARCLWRRREGRLEIGVADRCDHHRMPAGKDRYGIEERAGRGFVNEVGAHDDQGALASADRSEREVVVAVDERRLRVEDRAHHGFPAARRGASRWRTSES